MLIFYALLEMVAASGVVSLPVELAVDEPGSAFFMRPSQPWRSNRSVQEWPMVALAGAQTIRASYSSAFSYEVQLPASLLRQVAAVRGVAVSSRVIDGFGDVTAHFVTETVTSDRRQLQVLFHISRSVSASESSGSILPPPRVCVLLYGRRNNGDELATSCAMYDSNVCIADLTLPSRWWSSPVDSRTVSAFFGAFRLDADVYCDVSHYPPLRRLPADDAVTFIRQVTMIDGSATYQTLREDQHVLLRIPLGVFHPGSKFSASVQLQTGSKLATFSVRVKTRSGVRVSGVENQDASRWRLSVDLNQKRQTSTVTAYSLQRNSSVGINSVQDVFDWVFDVVDADAVRDDTGRLAFTIEYELASAGALRGHVENKVATRVQIQPDTTFAIVPVVKTNEIVNTAVLTGVVQSYSMTVYSVSHAGHVADVTSQATCHAGDADILQVSESCGFVFLDGFESRGSSSASVIVKYGRHARFIQFRVWIPELPLDVEVSDARLGRFVGWQVPVIVSNTTELTTSATDDVKSSSVSSSPESSGSDDPAAAAAAGLMPSCRPLYQSATVDVYARFVMADIRRGSPPYMLHRKALFRLTDLLRDRIRVTDESVARLRGGMVIDGLKPGVTEIEVISLSGRVLGTGELQVIDDTVIVDRLDVELVSGVQLSVEAKADFPGAIAAQVTKTYRLHSYLEEAIVDVSLAFDDGTLFPLSSLPPADYLLNVETLNSSVIARVPPRHPHLPQLVAMDSGRGDLVRVTLSPSAECAAVSKPSAVKVAVAHVDVHIVDSTAQRDARVNVADTWKNPGQLWIGKERGRSGADASSRDRVSRKDPVKSRDAALFSGSPAHPTGPNRSLELAMYILLVIFGIALAVFVINCTVFIVRRRRRSRAKDSGSSTADADWIWIGHEALKRNAVSVECMRTLMPAAEFGGPAYREMMALGHVADASPPPPPLPPKVGRPLSATLSLTASRARGRPFSMDPALVESVEMQQAVRSVARREPRSLARDSTASWHGKSSRSDTMSDMDWDCAGLAGVPSNHELIEYFDGLRESAA